MVVSRTSVVAILLIAGSVFADTFRHKTSGAVYTGYACGKDVDGKNLVITADKGQFQLNLSEYDIEWNQQGRNRVISVLPITEGIENEIETSAFEAAIAEEADKGPLYIMIEMDSPGGRVDLVKRLCAAVSGVKYCKTAAFIKGGKNGGAYSGGAAVSLACDKIYMVSETSIGAASMIAQADSGKVMDMKEAYGDSVGEKFNSAWRNYLASVAEENGRPGVLAKAMADKDVGVLEVKRDGKVCYTDQSLPGDQVVRTVCKQGQLLTLTANDAVALGLADGIVKTRQDLLVELQCPDAVFTENDKIAKARQELDKVVRRFNKLSEAIDLKLKELDTKSERGALTRSEAIRDFEVLIKSGENLLKLKRSYPDIPVEEEQIIELVNIIKAEQASAKAMR
ncbi:MAG: hypothetical protein LLF76_08565 [Planctomycetaceae bacterium]|nr:hypothetical protein [Planctomycetaceae bacterium]